MSDNCKISNRNWPEFTAGRAEDSFISVAAVLVCVRTLFTSQFTSIHDNMSLLPAIQTTVLNPLSLYLDIVQV